MAQPDDAARDEAFDDDVFGEPSRWRDEAAIALGLEGDDVLAALSPGAGFPGVLEAVVAALPDEPQLVVDLGAGAGGATEWLRRRLGSTVIAIEPTRGARDVARRRFPDLDVRDGRGDRSGLADGCADVVVLCGVLSLMADVEGVAREVSRVAGRPARLVVADLFGEPTTFDASPNTFRSEADVVKLLAGWGWRTVDVDRASPNPEPRWADVAASVDQWIAAHCAHRPGFDVWREDQRHLAALTASGRLIGGAIVATR